jgi:hypothetical protein
MKNLLFIVGICLSSICYSQTSLQKSQIAETGAFTYTFAPVVWEKTYSEDSSAMYFGSFERKGFAFEAIVVELKDMNGVSKEDLEGLLISYMDYLKTFLEVNAAVGYGKGHTNSSSEDAMGVLDYWSFADGQEAKTKGWINNQFLAVLYVKGKGEYPSLTEMDLFLDGFRFPSTK